MMSIQGWGQYITLPDYWRPVRRHFKSNAWNFHGSWADQGLLYYWTKYIKKSVSIVVGPEVEQWSPDNWEEGKGEDDQLVLRTREDGSITTVVTDPLRNYSCGMPRGFFIEPYTEFFHMTGKNKPWYKSRERLLEGLEKEKDLYGQWYGSLKEALIAVDSMDTFPWDDLFTRGGSLGSAPLYNVSASKLLYSFIAVPRSTQRETDCLFFSRLSGDCQLLEGKGAEKLESILRAFRDLAQKHNHSLLTNRKECIA